MKTETITVQKAVQDLAAIRRAIDSAQSNQLQNHPATLDANLVIQTLLFAIAATLVGVELTTGHSMSSFMVASNQDRELKVMGLIQVAFALPVLAMCVYYIVWRASRHAGQDLSTFVATHFQYLKNLGLLSDLLTKFIPLSFLVLASKTEWIAPLLCLYVGDYLIQGRLFTLPVRSSLILSVGCLAAAIAQYAFHSPLLVWPLALFAIVDGASLAFAIQRRKQISQSLSQGE